MFRRFLIYSILGLGLALAGLYVFRAALVEVWLADALTARGVTVGGLAVTRVGLEELHIADLSLGADGELRVRSLRLAFQPAALLRGEVAQVVAEGLVLRLDLSGAAPLFGSLQPLVAGAGGGSPGPLPDVEFHAARIEAATPLGPVTAVLNGEAWPEDAGGIAGAFSFTLESARGRLKGAFDAALAPDGEISGTLVVEDGVLSLPGAKATGLQGEASYAFTRGRPPRLDAWLSAGGIALPGAKLEEARLTLRTAANGAVVAARLRGNEGRWSLALDGTLEDYLAAPRIRIEVNGSATARAALWPLLALPEPTTGRAGFEAEAVGRLAPLSELRGEGVTVADWLSRATLEGHLTAELARLAYPARAEAVSGKLWLEGALEDGALAFRTPRPARLVFVGLVPDWLRALGLPAPMVPLLERSVSLFLDTQGTGDRNGLAGPVSVKLRTPGGVELDAESELRLELGQNLALTHLNLDALRIAARRIPLPGMRLRELRVEGALAGRPPALTGELDVRLDVEDLAVQALHAEGAQALLPIALEVTPGNLSLRLTGPGRVTLDEVSYGETVHLATLAAAVPKAELTYASDVLDHAATLAVAPSQIRVTRAAGDLVVELTPGTIEIQGSWTPDAPYRATAKIANAGLVLPAQEIAVAEISGSFVLGPAPGVLAAEIAVGAISDRAGAPRFTPLRGQLTARASGETVTFEGELGERAGAARLAISGRHDLAAGRGAAKLTLDPLTFSPGGLQPGALAPMLANLHEVTGGLRAEAEVAWSAEGLTGGAVLAVEDLSFDSDAAEVQGLDLALELSSLMPPASAPGQSLTVRRIDPGVAFENVSLRFQIHPGDPLRLGVERGQIGLSGGHVLLRDLLLDPAAARLELPLEVVGLDLAKLFRILDIEGLSGSGQLSGRIPITLEGETVTIANGRLAADAPGTLRFESAQARQALAGAGESAELMLRALQDFRYDELSLTIAKPAAADARLTLVLLGHNPEVLDGYPFRFNINLEGDTNRLAAALSQTYSLSNRMLRKFWRPGH